MEHRYNYAYRRHLKNKINILFITLN